MDEYLGIIKIFGGNFAPRGWFFCDGSILSISQYSALYSLLGTTYGGNGVTTFALPDLRSRLPIGSMNGAAGPGLSAYQTGQMGGTENVTLTQQQIPAHSHLMMVSSADSSLTAATAGASIATPGTLTGRTFTASYGFNTTTPATALNPSTISPSGGGNQQHTNIEPYLGVNYIICWSGIYPSRP